MKSKNKEDTKKEQALWDKIDEIIETVLRFIDCEHEVDKEENGFHHSVFYSVEKGCEEAVRKVLDEKRS